MAMYGVPHGISNPVRQRGPGDAPERDAPEHRIWGHAPGTIILVAVFLAAFILYYFTNWKLLSLVWRIG